MTNASRDFTVKVDVDGLEDGQLYFYRFKFGDFISPIGRTKTASINADSLQFALVSCSNYEWGYFTAYKHIGQRERLDAVIHLGDYIYEYAPGGYGDTTLGRLHTPPKELITLKDYRTRYAQYRSDKDLQLVHQNHPFIAIWDDHEIANDVYQGGAQNHQEDEGDFIARKEAAVKAYYEWMPVREDKTLYRKFEFGQLADLIMLDERLEGRTAPVDSVDDPEIGSEERSMLGAKQLQWLKRSLKTDAKWKILGNQVIFSDLDQSTVFPDNPKNLDSWNGYPAEKNNVASFILKNGIRNVIFATGDTHASWAMEAMVKDVSLEPVGTEFGTPSITSANFDEYSNLDTALMAANLYADLNPHLRYVNLHDHGYILLTLTMDQATARYYYVEDLRQPNAEEYQAKKVWIKGGEPLIR
jgi:alkaline phosphatase D